MASSAMLTTTAAVTETSLAAAIETPKVPSPPPTTTKTSTPAAGTTATSTATSAAAVLENDDDDECKDDDVLNTSLHSCANDPDFAIICAFLQKFAKELGIELPSFKRLQEWLTNTDEVAAPIRDLHIKLLRKTRKTVHEKCWESAVSKFCFTYSAQDGWEVERFGYKQASLKVKLRILRELLESQFERNNKFRNKMLTLSADSLRTQPIGRDRLGHSYWLTQDGDCNLRIYQEHLDEEIWQVVATNRDEFVNLIARLRGNEVVLPSTDIGVIDEDTSSSNSCNVPIEKPPPPVEQDDSQEDEAKVVPNLRLKLGEGGAYHSTGKDVGKGEEELAAEEDKKLEQKKIQQQIQAAVKARNQEEEEEEAEAEAEEAEEEDVSSENGEEEGDEVEEEAEEEVDSADEDQSGDDVEENDSEPAPVKEKAKQTIPIVVASVEEAQKKVKPLLISQAKIASSIAAQHNSPANGSQPKKRPLDEVDKTSPKPSEDNNANNAIKKFRPSLLDSKRDKKPSKYEKVKSDEEDDEDDDEGSEEEDDDDGDIDDDEGEEEDIDSAAAEEDENEEKDIEEDDDDDEVGEAIEDPPLIVRGEGSGKQCDGANPEFLTEFSLFDETTIFLTQDEDTEPEVGEAIEEEYLYISGEGNGAECLVGNKNNEEPPTTPPATTMAATMIKSNEPQATFFFGEPGCLKLSPIKKSAESSSSADARSNDEETFEEQTDEISANNKEQKKLDADLTKAEDEGVSNVSNTDKSDDKNNVDKAEEQNREISKEKINDENSQKTCETLNEIKEQKVEAVETNTKSNVHAEEALNVSEIKSQSNIKENNSSENENNEKDLNNKLVEQPALEKSKTTAIDNNTESVELNGIGSNEVCAKNQEVELKKLPEPTSETQQSTRNEEASEKSEQNNFTAVKIVNEILQKPNNSETVPKNLNLVPQKEEEETKTKTVIKKVVADLEAEKITHTTEQTSEKLIQPKLTDEHEASVTHKEALNKTSDAVVLNEPLGSTPQIAILQKRALPEKNATEDAPATTTTAASLINRKRRLAVFAETQKPKMRPQTTSESEVELPEEPLNVQTNEELEDDAAYVGGKRLKMRAKLTNTEIRKKVEAQKIAAVEETTSSSGEEEALRKRKIISPKRLLVAHKNNKIELPSNKLEKETHNALAEIKEEVAVAPSPVPVPVPVPVKQKPTLAEIIEKKLKKTPEKPVKLTAEDAATSSEVVAVLNAASTFTIAPLKKSPITKPLKKNLLTQLRQEESDEEAIPRKRIIGETLPPTIERQQSTTSPVAVPTASTSKLNLDEQPKVEHLTRATPERIASERQRKRRSSEEVQHPELTEHAPNVDCVGEKLKKNDADEIVATAKEPKVQNISITKKLLERTQEEEQVTPAEIPVKADSVETPALDVKPEVKEEEEAAAGLSGRRSGRRGGTAVIYSELPQPKRTRGGPKATPAAVITPRKEETEPKIDATETKPKEEETKKPQVKQEEKIAAKTEPTESKEANSEAEDSADDVKKPEMAKKPTKTPPKARGRKKREVDTTNIIETADSEPPVRQSRRIAQQKIREEAERRKLEEIALRTMKNELKKKKKAQAQADPSVPEPSEQSSSSDESDASEIEEETKKLKKKKCPGKDGTWSSGSEEQEEPEEEEEPPHYETDPGSPLFRSDHEFSPESDLEDESQVVPMKRARTARKEDSELSDSKQLAQEEEACQKCGKSDHPEWILLCDSCDKGYHCSCLSPVLFYIPEGDWYCPPCQQEQLIAALEKQLQEFDFLVKQKRIEEEQAQILAEEAERAENQRREEEKRKKKKKKQRGDDDSSDNDAEENASTARKSGKDSGDGDDDDGVGEDDDDEKSLKHKDKKAKKNQSNDKRKQRREVGGHRRRRRRAATRGARRRRRNTSKSGGSSGSDASDGSGSQSGTGSESSSNGSSSSSSATDSDDEPIYKLRKRRQINVSYRLNEYDDLINSALKKEMDEAAIAGNLGRGKDITTIIEADKEEQARQKQLVDGELVDVPDTVSTEVKTVSDENKIVVEELVVSTVVTEVTTEDNVEEQKRQAAEDVDSEEEPLKRKAKVKQTLKKKPRKLTTLDISSEEDNASDEDFKGSSLDDEDEDTSVSVSSNSDSSLEIYRRRGKKGGKKKTRKAARRTARERRKVRKFVVDDSDDDEEEEARPKTKKKRKTDSDYTESEESGELSELSENMDSADLCDDSSSSEDSDGAWRPSKRKKQRKSTAANIARKSPKLKKPQTKKPKRVEYSDDDVSEDEEEDYEDEDDDPATGGKGSGKQPRTVPLKASNSGKGKGKGKGGAGSGKSSKATAASKKKKKKLSDYEDNSFSDSEDSTRRTRGRRYAYLEDFEDDSSDGGIKPGVKRPDTPPEEREKFIKKQEEIKRMLAEKNAEGAKLAATPRLTPIKGGGTRSPAKPGDSLSTVPLSVIRQAKVLDIDYLQRKGESVSDVDNVDDVDSEFDDADLPDDFPEDMDEDAIARMVEEEEEFGAAAASRELPAPDEVLKSAAAKAKPKDAEKPPVPSATNASLAALAQMPSNAGGSSHPTTTFASGLQEPMRKRLPMPTMHPPLLRHQYPGGGGQHHHSLPPHMMQRHAGPPTHLLQNALSAPLGQPVHRNFPQQAMGAQRGPPGGGGMPPRHVLPSHALPPPQQQLTASHPLPGSAGEAEAKPRGRRKKITPLRDPLQKQQAAAAATAAAAVQAATTGNASEKRETSPPTSVETGVIKTATSLAVAQPPQLFKPSGGSSAAGQQPSVITRMPHLPPHGAPSARGMPLGPPGMYAGGDVARFYGPPMQQPSGAPGSRMPPASSQRHRGPPHVGSMPPHHGMRPSYGPPPPLRGVIGSSNQPPPNSVSGTRPPYPPPPNHGEHHGPQSSGPYGPPPPARHAAPHINPYRPSIFGNPNYGPRGAPPGASMRTAGPPGQEYPAGPPRSYAPYGYYPPPPPLTAAHPPPPSTHPSPSTTHAPPTSKPPAASTTRTSTSNTQPPAVPSSVIVSAPPSSISLTPSAAAAQKHAARAVIKTAPPAAAPSKSTPAAVVAPSAAVVEPRKKLITLETFATSKSPLALSGESSGSRSSPNVQPDGADDSTSTPAVATSGGNGQGASEFSGLVSYFSSQHDDYNT